MMDDPVIGLAMFLILFIVAAIGTFAYFNKTQQEYFKKWDAEQKRYADDANETRN